MNIVPTHAAPSWQAKCCYIAAAIFTTASAGTNAIYGWSRGTDIASSVVWTAVSIAVSVVFAFSWPATIGSIDRKEWSLATMAVIALLLTGTYSVSAALGSAMGGRASAAIEEQDGKERKAKAQAKWDTAKKELDQLDGTKPGSELQSLIDAAKAELAKLPATRSIAELEALTKQGCPARPGLNGQGKAACPKYTVELGRAWERSRLTSRITELNTEIGQAEQRRAQQWEKAQGVISAAEGELAAHGSPRPANSDAVALATYLQALGLSIDADRVNKLLVLLAVLVIECGGGLALAVGMALSDKGVSDQHVHRGTTHPCAPPSIETPPVSAETSRLRTVHSSSLTSRARIFEMVRDANGLLRTGHRALAEALGISPTRAGQLLRELAKEGAIRVRASKTGSVITLAEIAAITSDARWVRAS